MLDDVELLLDDVDADTVAISADPGNAIDEFGVTGHPADALLPAIGRVPWVETSAKDAGRSVPDSEAERDSDSDVNERLKHLGYRE